MSDLVTDGTRIWARVHWRVKGGREIDASKIMLMDTGMPMTGISASNLDPDLTIIGMILVGLLDCVGLGLVIDGGEMSLNIDGKNTVCSKPVVYSPCYESDFLGLDQILELGLIRGLTVAPHTPQPFVTLPPARVGDLYPFIAPFVTIRPGTHPVRITPRPGLFSFLGTLAPQGSISSPAWAFEQFWPQVIPTGSQFDVAVALSVQQNLEFISIALEVPNGFTIIDGDPSRTIPAPKAGHTETIQLRLLAPRSAGDYFWRSNVRAGTTQGLSAGTTQELRAGTTQGLSAGITQEQGPQTVVGRMTVRENLLL